MARRRKEKVRNVSKHRMPSRQTKKNRPVTGFTRVVCPECQEMAVFIFMAYQDETPKRRPYCRHCERVIGRDIHLPLSAFAKTFLPRHWR